MNRLRIMSEMAIALLESLVQTGGFDAVRVRQAYRSWLATDPSDVGLTIRGALAEGYLNPQSDTNGAIAGALLGAFFGSEKIPAAWRDAVLTARLDRPERYSARHADALLARLLRHEP